MAIVMNLLLRIFSLVFALLSCIVAAAPCLFEDIYASEIQWADNCTYAPGKTYNPLLQCGTLQVPMNWNHPLGRQITIDLRRLRTSNKDKLGSLFINPGGPGASAANFCYGLSEDINANLDIICVDPRGVGISSRVKCDVDLWNQRPSLHVEDEQSFDKILDFSKALAESCLAATGPLLEFVDTTSAAKDLDAVRIALGEDKMNWLGFSYGSQLGAAYAELFPTKVRTMVLDGVLNHALGDMEGYLTANWAMEDELKRFFHWCDRNQTCALYGGQNSSEIWDDLIASANRDPLAVPADVRETIEDTQPTPAPASGYDIIFNLENNFAKPSHWPSISEAIKEAVQGNTTQLANTVPNNEAVHLSMEFPNLAIGCLDWASPPTTYEEYVTLQTLSQVMFPHTLGSSMWLQWRTICMNWPFKPTNPQHALDPTSMAELPPVLIVNSEHDPATPLAWAHGVSRQIPSSVLVVRKGDGHTDYRLSRVAEKMINAYIVDGTVPPRNTVLIDEEADMVPDQ